MDWRGAVEKLGVEGDSDGDEMHDITAQLEKMMK